jgi:SAM-dependent methyltransferase
MLTAALEAACPAALRFWLERYLDAEISAEITLMHFLIGLGAAEQLMPLLEGLRASAPQRKEIARLVQVATANRAGLSRAGAVITAGVTNPPPGGADAIATVRAQYDRAVAAAPEAAVALYCLGSAEILDQATREIVAQMTEWHLLGSDRDVLDIGCGIGRIEKAVAGKVRRITGIDISAAMIGEAQRRCAGLPNVVFLQTSGRDLTMLHGNAYDLVLAVDCFPYLVAAGTAAQHVADAARLLRPAGSLVILNFSYRGDIVADLRDLNQFADGTGLRIVRGGTRDFTLWDGISFLLQR